MRLIDADALKEAFYQKMKELLKSTNTPQINNEALSLLCGSFLITEAPTITDKEVVAEFLKQGTFKIHIPEAEPFPTKLVGLSDESIEKIADVVVKKLHQSEQSGYWINDGYYGDNHPQVAYRCSNCDEQYIGYPGEFKYCPNCGMKMVNKDG